MSAEGNIQEVNDILRYMYQRVRRNFLCHNIIIETNEKERNTLFN